MLDNSLQGPLKICLLDISPHNKAILEFFFAGAGRSHFKVVTDENEASAFIIDFDHPGAQDSWQTTYAQKNKPGIVLSVHSIDTPYTVWLSKPLTSQALSSAADQAKDLISSGAPTTTDTAKITEENTPPPPPENAKPEVEINKPSFKKPDLAAPKQNLQAKPNRPAKPAIAPKLTLVSKNAEDEEEIKKEVEQALQAQEDAAEEAIDHTEPQQSFAESTAVRITPEMEKRWEILCGSHEDIPEDSSWDMEAISFTPENYFFNQFSSIVKNAKETNQHVGVEIDSHKIVILPTTDHVYSELDVQSENFEKLCNTPTKNNQIQSHILSTQESDEMTEKLEHDSTRLHDLESFTWTLALLTSQGRLPRDTDANKLVALKHWPNFTRLESFPEDMRIAALWAHAPISIIDISKKIALPQKYIIAFYNAANALGLIEHDQSKLENKQQKTVKKKDRGLFSRLLKRLLG